MIEDFFMSWYEERFPDLDPSIDDCYWDIRSAYYAGWQRHYAIDMALWELQELSQQELSQKDYQGNENHSS